MIIEKERLKKLLNENKISAAEYKLLGAAIDKKQSRVGMIFSLLANPFQKVAGLYALISGLIVILCMSYLGVIAKCYSIGIIGCLNASVVQNPKMHATYFVLLYQNSIVWLVMTFLYITFAKTFQQKRLRLVDFFGTVALSRFPFFIIMLVLAITRTLNPNIMNVDLTKGLQLHPSLFMTLLSAVLIICFIWQVVTYFFALKESSGLTGKNLWISYIAAMILGEVIASSLTMTVF